MTTGRDRTDADDRGPATRRELGVLDLFCIASGAMISSGLFVLPGIAYARIGPAVFLAYMLASILVIPAMLSKAELSTAMPRAGGAYFFIDRSMGAGLGTVAGLTSWLSLSLKSAFALLGIGAFAVLLFPGLDAWHIRLVAGGFCLAFGLLNLFSTRHAGGTQVLLVVGLLAILVLYVILGADDMQVRHFEPFRRGSFRELFATAGLIFVSYGGLTKVASVAGEARNPSRTIPLSMILSFAVVSVLYVLAVVVTVGVVGSDLLVDGQPLLTPLSEGGRRVLGRPGMFILSVGAILAFVSTGNAGILTASRVPMAMSRDHLLPDALGRVSGRFHTPMIAICCTTGFMLAVILCLDLVMLVKTASTIMLLLFALVNVAVVLMRESRVLTYRPRFRCPGYPWVQMVGIAAYGYLIFEMGRTPLVLTAGFVLIAVLWYIAHGRVRSRRVSALAHVVRRLTAREMRENVLHSELKRILLERDEIVADRFDHLVADADVFDLEGTQTVERLFDDLSTRLADRTGLRPDAVLGLLTKREAESSTVLAPGLAVPHIILPGEGRFELLVARSREGIAFPGSDAPVHAVFALAGTPDERNFHLKALMSIAQIVQQGDFIASWLKLRTEAELRDYLLLSERTRSHDP